MGTLVAASALIRSWFNSHMCNTERSRKDMQLEGEAVSSDI